MDPYSSTITAEKAKELVDAQAHLWNHIFNFLNSLALKSALELGIPDAVHRHGKPITLTELTNSLPIHPTKATSLGRLMRLLCHSNFFSINKLPNRSESVFDLTINSQLLLKDHPLSQAPLALVSLDPILTDPSHKLGSWFLNEEDSPFHVAHGRSIWEHACFVTRFNEGFNQAMASDSRLVASLLLPNNECKGLFEGLESLVDVGGGNGTIIKAIAKAYPGLKCIVLDLPHVVEGLQGDGISLVYVGGDMFEAIPPAKAVLLRSDEHCVKIFQRCKEARRRWKDNVVETQNDVGNYFVAQILVDMDIVCLTSGGKFRNKEEWNKLFLNAGCSDYKILSVLGLRSIIVIHPS